MPNEHSTVIYDLDETSGQDENLREQNAHPLFQGELGGGDIFSVEEVPSTDDDQSL